LFSPAPDHAASGRQRVFRSHAVAGYGLVVVLLGQDHPSSGALALPRALHSGSLGRGNGRSPRCRRCTKRQDRSDGAYQCAKARGERTERCHGCPGLARLSDRSRLTEVQRALICRRTGSRQRRAKQECAEKCDTKENCSDLPTEPRAAPPGQHGLVSGRTRPVKLSLNYHRSPSITIAGSLASFDVESSARWPAP